MSNTPYEFPPKDGKNSSLDPSVYVPRTEQFITELKERCEQRGVKIRLVPRLGTRPACLLFTDPRVAASKKKLAKIENVTAINDYLDTYKNGFSDTLKTLKLMMGEDIIQTADEHIVRFILDNIDTNSGTFRLHVTHNLQPEEVAVAPDESSFTAKQALTHIEQHTNPIYLLAKMLKDRGFKVIGDAHLRIDPAMAGTTVRWAGKNSDPNKTGRAQ